MLRYKNSGMEGNGFHETITVLLALISPQKDECFVAFKA